MVAHAIVVGAMVKPAYFGSSSRPLFGIHEPPRIAGGRETAVLLCYPGVQEYNMAHWAFRRLSGMLSREGFHTLRFDWSGTGDSWGESTDAAVETWLEDIGAAAQELRDATGASSLAIVGMRLGAALATLACSDGIAADKLVLWEPVVVGRRYIAELETLDLRENKHLLYHSRPRRDELVGFPFSRSLRTSLERLDVRTRLPKRAKQVAMVTSSELGDYLGLRDALTRAGVRVSFDCVPEDESSNAGEHATALLATRSLVTIVDRLCEREPSRSP